MPELAIQVHGVTKVFRIYDRPGDRLKEAFSLTRKKLHTDFPALRNVSFDVLQGTFLGIVGKNGAGKSTLLRILSRELTPTSGSVVINGKVSLLQLGVGFDPELTGIDNARFASKLLGYRDDEIDNMLEDIAAFADIGEFIRHPVKTYSSGMHSRLSFAVGVNINPDILIADEVLSVGDMRFAQKCMRRMRDFKDRGKTIIFVSHDIHSINAFCDTAMWIRDGELYMQGECKQVTICFQNYMLYDKLPDQHQHSSVQPDRPVPNAASASPMHDLAESLTRIEWMELDSAESLCDGRAVIQRMAFVVADTLRSARSIQGNEEVILLLDVEVKARMERPEIGFVIYNRHGLPALHSNNNISGTHLDALDAGQRVCAKFQFRMPSMANGSYIFSLGVQTGQHMAHKVDGAYEFTVARSDTKAIQCGYAIIEQEEFELLGLPARQAPA